MYKVTKDELLLDSLVEHTRKKKNDCKNLLKYKSVQVNGEVQTYHAFKLHPGDEVEVVLEETNISIGDIQILPPKNKKMIKKK